MLNYLPTSSPPRLDTQSSYFTLTSLPALRLVRLDRVGTYGLQPIWADGHATGIYSFDYLRRAAEASEKPEAAEFKARFGVALLAL